MYRAYKQEDGEHFIIKELFSFDKWQARANSIEELETIVSNKVSSHFNIPLWNIETTLGNEIFPNIFEVIVKLV